MSIDKVELAKLLGLEESFIPYFDGTLQEMGFCVGDKYFTSIGYTLEECWTRAAGRFISDLTAIATVHYSNYDMWEQLGLLN